jgi:Cu2+-exporting ATPase
MTKKRKKDLYNCLECIIFVGYMENSVKKTFPVLQMGCAACATRVENTIRKQDGVVSAAVNFAAANALVEYLPTQISPKNIRNAVQDAGYDLLVAEDDTTANLEEIQKKNLNP